LINTVAARRYAQAIFQIAQEKNELDKWLDELGKMTGILKLPELQGLLEAAKIPFAKKQRLLAEALAGLSPLALNIAYLLVSRGKLALIEQVYSEYSRLLDESYGVEHIAVTTAVPLGKQETERLAQRFSRAVG